VSLHVLIADDARDIADVVAFGARVTWPDCTVTIAAGGAEALRAFAAAPADLVILDVQMPAPDGFEVCRRIRAVSAVPILMLTVRDSTPDKVRALDLGADDYVTKPFDHIELLARLRALARRAQSVAAAPAAPDRRVDVIGDIALDAVSREVRVRGEVTRLTTIEYRLLDELMRHTGVALSHRHLLEQVWGPEYAGDVSYLKVYIRRLRRKLGDDPDRPRYIATEWGTGYRFIPAR